MENGTPPSPASHNHPDASELRFRGLFEQTPVSMQRFTPAGASIKVNRAFERMFHLTDAQLASAGFNLLHDRQIAESGLLPVVQKAFAGEVVLTEPTPFNPHVAVPGGRAEERYIRGHFFPLRASDGHIDEIVAMHEDVTDLVRTERALKDLNRELEAKVLERTEALQASEQRLRAIVETQTEWIVRFTREGVVTYQNPAYERRENSAGRPSLGLGAVWWYRFQAELAASLRRQLAELTPASPMLEFVDRRDEGGSTLHEHWVLRAIFEESGQLREFQAAGRDVTELIAAERRIQESEARFQRLFEDAPVGVVLLDGLTFVSVNPAYVRLMGLERTADVIGRSLLDFSATLQAGGIPSADAARQMASLRKSQGSARFLWKCRNMSGKEFTIEAFSSTVLIAGQSMAQVILHDISEQLRAEEELRNALERERELNQLKSNFISMVSHEYRNPLGIILTSTELLKRHHDQLTPEERTESILDIEIATKRMAAMIDNLLLMGKADAGKLELVPRPLDLVELSRIIANEVVSAQQHQREITFEAGDIHALANTDEQMLRLILTNLLGNALKYSPPGKAARFQLSRVGRHAVFSIHDEGIGIPEEDRPALFQAFRRARNVGPVNGTGLGLYIVKRCVDLHGGTIELESAIGKGTTVTVTLPLFPALTDLAVPLSPSTTLP